MQNLLTNIEQLVSKTDKKLQETTFPKIIENLSDLIIEIQKSQNSDINKEYKAFQKVLSSTLTFPFGEGTNEYLISRMIGRIYIKLMGACDMTQNQGLIDGIMAVVTSSKFKLNTKLICMATLGIILKNAKDMASFPVGMIQEFFQSLHKACKSMQDVPIRLVIINAMRLVIKLGYSLNQQNTQDFMKLILRYIAEKSDEVKLCCARALLSFLNNAPWSDSITYCDQIASLCSKTMDENVIPDLKRQLTFCYTKINIIRIHKMSDPTNALHSKKHSKGSDPVDKIYELMHIFANEFLRNENLRPFQLDFLYLTLIYFKNQLNNKDISLIIDTMLTLLGKSQPNQLAKSERLIAIFLRDFISVLTHDFKFIAMAVALEKLKNIIKADRSEENKKKAAPKGPIQYAQTLFLLKTVLNIIESLGLLIVEKYLNSVGLTEMMGEFLGYDNLDIQITAAFAYHYLANAYPRARAQMISILLNTMTMTRAEIATSLPETSKEEIKIKGPQYLTIIRGCSLALSLLIRNIDFEFKSIPFDIATTVFEGAKHLVTEEFEGEISKIMTENACYSSLGWSLIGELMSLEYHWVGSRIKVLFDLWRNLFFTDEVKADTEDAFKTAIFERIYAFKALRKFTSNCKKLQTENILKVLGTFISSYASIIFTKLKDNQFKSKLEKNSSEIISARIDLYQACNLIQSSFYSSKFNLILQNAIEDVANYLHEESFLLVKKHFQHHEFDLAYLMDYGPKYFKILFSLEDIYTIEDGKKQLCEYDLANNFFSRNLTNSRFILVREQLTFIGNAFVATHFTNKNKMQLLNFLLSNVKSCQAAKDPFLKIQKLFSLLMITLAIVNKMYTEYADKQETIDQDILTVFKDICDNAWIHNHNHARVNCALIYAMLFKLAKSVDFQQALLKNLYDNLNDTTKGATIAAIIGFIFKFNPTLEQNIFLQLADIFIKTSRNADETSAVWLVNSLRLGLEHFPNYSNDLIKSCLPFMTRYHYQNKESGRAFFIAWSYLIEILTKRLLSLNVGRMYHIDALIIDLDNTEFIIPDRLLKDAKLSLTSAVITSPQIADDIKKKHTKSVVKLLMSEKNPGKLVKIPEKALDLMQQVIENGNNQHIDLFEKNFVKILIDKINRNCNKRDSRLSQVEKLYQRLTSVQLELLKLKFSSFEEQLKYFKEIVFPEKETIEQPGEGEKKEKVPNKGKINFSFSDDLSLGTRVYALKAVEDLLQLTDLSIFKSKDVVNFANLVIPFIFKVASCSFESLKEIGIRAFTNLFSKMIIYDEQGEIMDPNFVSDDISPIMQQYGAQIDALIRLNLKDINQNSSLSVVSSIKLYFKFFLLMYKVDASMVKRLFTLLVAPIQQPLKLSQGTFHSERALTEIHFARMKVLCKVYNYFIQNMATDSVLSEEFENFFPVVLKKFIEQNLAGIIEDSSLVVIFPRRDLKNYSNFFFIYNGTKISYDEKQVYSCLTYILEAYYSILAENLDLDQILHSIHEEEIKKYLKNNQKSLPPKDKSLHVSIVLLNYLLTHNETYESINESVSKRSKRLYDFQGFKMMNNKVELLKALQQIMKSRTVIEQNFEVLVETINILTNYVNLGSPAIIIEILKVYSTFLNIFATVDNFEIVSTSLVGFHQTNFHEIISDYAIWAESLAIFFDLWFDLIAVSVSLLGDGDQNPNHPFYFLGIILQYACCGNYNIRNEALRSIKQGFLKLNEILGLDQQKTELISSLYSKFGCFALIKLSDQLTSEDAKYSLLDLLITLDQLNQHFSDEKGDFMTETIAILNQNSRILKNYLIYLRTLWKNIKLIHQDRLPYILKLIKFGIESITRRQPTPEDNEFVIEAYKFFIYIFFESKAIDNNALLHGILGFLVSVSHAALDPQAFAIMGQLMSHISKQVQIEILHDQLKKFNQDETARIYKIVPDLQTLIQQSMAQLQNSMNNKANNSQAKPALTLKVFGKK